MPQRESNSRSVSMRGPVVGDLFSTLRCKLCGWFGTNIVAGLSVAPNVYKKASVYFEANITGASKYVSSPMPRILQDSNSIHGTGKGGQAWIVRTCNWKLYVDLSTS